MNEEDRAIVAVVRGHHPGNWLARAPLLGPVSRQDLPEVVRFLEAIPKDWSAFRRVTRWWLMEEGYPVPVEHG